MSQNDQIQLFEDKRIRTAWNVETEEWYFFETISWHLKCWDTTNKRDGFDTKVSETIVLFLFAKAPVAQGFSAQFPFGLVSFVRPGLILFHNNENVTLIVEHSLGLAFFHRTAVAVHVHVAFGIPDHQGKQRCVFALP